MQSCFLQGGVSDWIPSSTRYQASKSVPCFTAVRLGFFLCTYFTLCPAQTPVSRISDSGVIQFILLSLKKKKKQTQTTSPEQTNKSYPNPIISPDSSWLSSNVYLSFQHFSLFSEPQHFVLSLCVSSSTLWLCWSFPRKCLVPSLPSVSVLLSLAGFHGRGKAQGIVLWRGSVSQTGDGEKWKQLPAVTGHAPSAAMLWLFSVAWNDVRLAAEQEKYLEE